MNATKSFVVIAVLCAAVSLSAKPESNPPKVKIVIVDEVPKAESILIRWFRSVLP